MQLLDTEAVARRFAECGIEIGRDEIAGLARNGAFPNSAIKTKGKWYISLAEVDEYISHIPSSDEHEIPLINNQKIYITDAATRLGISVDKVRELCKYGYFKGAYQLWDNGPWQIRQDAVEALANRKVNLEKIPTNWDRIRYWIVTNKGKSVVAALITIIGLFFGAISAGADIGGAREQLLDWGLIREYSSANNEEILIVIAAFDSTEGLVDVRIHSEIHDAIESTATQLGFSTIRVEIDPRRIDIHNKERAKEIAQQSDASIIIWGEDTGVKVSVNYLIPGVASDVVVEGSIIETVRTQLAYPSEYAEFILTDLPTQLAFLSLFATGQAAYLVEDNEAAIKIIEAGISSLEGSSPVDGIAYAYLELGRLNLNSDRYEQATVYFDQVVSLGRNTRTEVGSVYYFRALAKYYTNDLDGAFDDFYRDCGAPADTEVAHCISYAYWHRAVLNSIAEKYDEAIIDLEEAARFTDQTNPVIITLIWELHKRGWRYLHIGKIEAANEDFTNAVQLFEDDKDPDLSHLEIFVDPYELYYGRGVSYFFQGEFSKAHDDFDTSIRYENTFALGFYMRGLTRSLLDIDGAKQDITHALELNPNLRDLGPGVEHNIQQILDQAPK